MLIVERVIREIYRIGTVRVHEVNLPVAIAFGLKQNFPSVRRPLGHPVDAKWMVYGKINPIRAIGIHDVDVGPIQA